MRVRLIRLVTVPLVLLTAFGTAVAQNPPAEDVPAQVRRWLAQSREHERHGDYEAAMHEVQQARRLAATVHDDGVTAEVWCQLAAVRWRRAEYATGLDAAATARDLLAPLGPSPALMRVLTVQAAIHQARGELDKALAHYLDSLRVAEQLGDEVAVARARNNIGLAYWDLGRHEDAYRELLAALAVHERLGPRDNLGNTLCNLGMVLVELDRPQEALPFLERTLAMDIENGDLYGQAKCHSNLGFAHEKLGDEPLAFQQHLQALQLREQIGDKEGIVRSRGAVAGVQLRRGEAQLAVELLQQAIALAAEIDDRRDEAELLRSLSAAREALGDHAGALQAFREHHERMAGLVGAETRDRVAELEKRLESEAGARNLAAAESLAASHAAALRWMVVCVSLLLGCIGLLVAGRLLRARAQRELADSERRYRTLFHSSTVPTLLIDVTTLEVVDRNQATLAEGGAGHDLPGALDELQPGWMREVLLAALDTAAGEHLAFDDSIVGPGGATRWFEVRGDRVAVGKRSCWLLTVRDTSDARALEAARTLAAKMESLGVLAGGIAHDFNNALTAIGGNLALAREADAQELSGLLANAEQEAMAARRLSTRLLAFARGGEPVRRRQDVGALVRESVERTRAQAACTVDVQIEAGLSRAALDAGQFALVVTQLVRNAQQAMDGRGRIEVRVGNWRGVAEDPALAGSSPFVRIDVADRGGGVPPAIVERILEPYFTTRAGASGLGLPTAYAICRRHGGALAFAAREGGGTTFSVWFPAEAAPLVADAAATPAPTGACPAPHGNGGVLVLEDEVAIQQVLRGMLQRWGFTVQVVADGREAVRCYREHLQSGTPFEFAIMDLTIPGGVGGKQAMAEILAIDGAARAIVASGYSDDPTMAHCREAGFAAALAKPFLKEELARAILTVQGAVVEQD